MLPDPTAPQGISPSAISNGGAANGNSVAERCVRHTSTRMTGAPCVLCTRVWLAAPSLRLRFDELSRIFGRVFCCACARTAPGEDLHLPTPHLPSHLPLCHTSRLAGAVVGAVAGAVAGAGVGAPAGGPPVCCLAWEPLSTSGLLLAVGRAGHMALFDTSTGMCFMCFVEPGQ
jgi:hypothetical protein